MAIARLFSNIMLITSVIIFSLNPVEKANAEKEDSLGASPYATDFIKELGKFISDGDTLKFEKTISSGYQSKIPGYRISLVKTKSNPVFRMTITKEEKTIAIFHDIKRVIEGNYSLNLHFRIVEHGAITLNKIIEKIGSHEFLYMEILPDETAVFRHHGRELKLDEWWLPPAYISSFRILFNCFIFDRQNEYEEFLEVKHIKNKINQTEI